MALQQAVVMEAAVTEAAGTRRVGEWKDGFKIMR